MNPYKIEYDKGIINRGNWYRIKKAMEKAKKQKEITVGFLGGSITQGCLSSTPKTCYSYLVYEWWKKKFPDTNVRYVNAGIGATTSAFGVARVEDDLLSKKVDFTVVEFSVNDEATPHFKETYESLLRRILLSNEELGVLVVNSVFYDTGVNSEEIHVPVAKAYGIPCVSMRTTIYDALQRGEFTNREITQDDLHPNDLGHKMMAEVICHLLDQIYDACEEKDGDEKLAIPDALTKNGFEHAKRYQNACSTEILCNEGFTKDLTQQKDIREIFRNGWTADKLNAKIVMKLKGSSFLIQYRKSVLHPAPVAKAVIDGDEKNAVIMDANFKETWGDLLAISNLALHLPYGEHEIEIRLITVHENIAVPFYLVSVIAA